MSKIIVTLLILCCVIFILSGCSNYYTGKKSDHFDGKRFFNPGKPMDKSFGAFLKWQRNRQQQPWPDFEVLQKYDKPPPKVEGSLLRISFVGHATVLIQTEGLNILTDPVWSERVSPVSWAGPKRVHPPGIIFEDLPPIDVVLISHNHYDHLDLITLELLWTRDQPRIIVPLGNDKIIAKYNKNIATESYDWSETFFLNERVKLILEPMHHWSARGMFDRNKALWAAFVLQAPGGNIYFVGDSGFGGGDYFKEARQKYQSFRFAILPVGSYDPRWFMAYGHMNPEEGIDAWELLGRPYTLPTHYRTFPLADTGYEQGQIALLESVARISEAQDKFMILSAGESRFVP